MSSIKPSSTASPSKTISETSEATTTQEPENEVLVLRLAPQQPENSPRVHWSANTVDNEHMNKKKSKCCCIYKKQRRWDEDSSGSDDEMETDHCRGHVEKKCNH
uniref:E3 ubiquitin-protein ligase PPP1R11 n=1 Tax=Strongyloides venezuelensis TaxID=75913 RepID=A0A0K0G0H1_STRVS